MTIFHRVDQLERQAKKGAEIVGTLEKHYAAFEKSYHLLVDRISELTLLLKTIFAPPMPGEIKLVIDERIDEMSVLYHLVLPAADVSLASKATKRTLTGADGVVQEVPLDQLTVDGLIGEVGGHVTGVLTDSNAAGETAKPFDLVIPEPAATAAPVVGDVQIVVDGPAPEPQPVPPESTVTPSGTDAAAGV
jgi:hypothetical protein